jgi:HK97 family phage prohead protease
MTIRTRSAAPAVSPEGFVPGSTLDRRTGDAAVRFAPGSYNASSRTVDLVLSSGARVRRWGIFEELAIAPEAVDLARAATGQVRLLDSHRQESIGDILGSISDVRFDGGLLVGRATFADTEAGRSAEAMVARGEVPGVSMGYRVLTWTLSQVENEVEVWRADRWELLEVSLVSVPADPAARVRAAVPASQQEIDDMRRNAPSAESPAPTPVTTPAPVETRAAAPSPAASAPDYAAERTRSAGIHALGAQHALPADLVARGISEGMTLDQFRAAAFDQLAARHAPASHVRIERDETETRRLGMQDALARAFLPNAPAGDVPESTRPFMGRSLVSLAAERLNERHVPENFAGRSDLIQRALHTTSDFPILLENALNRGLGASYDLAPQTYREIAVREDFNDFRPHDTVTVGDFPLLQPIAEAGKIQFGSVGEKKETVSVIPYAIGLSISRQLMVNDSLGGIARVLATYGQSVALFEERTFYAMKALNSGAGPTLLEGATAMFATARGNLAASGTVINVANIGAARAAMRAYRSLPAKAGETGNELLFNAPRILLVGPAQETNAEQFLTTITPATNATAVPASMRSLRPVVSQMIVGNAWELYTEPSVRSNFRWGLLNGYTAPRIRIEDPFGTQGTMLSVEHDFGCGGIDWRAAYRNPGA